MWYFFSVQSTRTAVLTASPLHASYAASVNFVFVEQHLFEPEQIFVQVLVELILRLVIDTQSPAQRQTESAQLDHVLNGGDKLGHLIGRVVRCVQ